MAHLCYFLTKREELFGRPDTSRGRCIRNFKRDFAPNGRTYLRKKRNSLDSQDVATLFSHSVCHGVAALGPCVVHESALYRLLQPL